MRKTIFYIAIFAVLLMSCSSDESNLSEEQFSTSENIYLEFNQWVYSEMNRQYLWREDLPDSLNCNYDLAPRDFFNSLLSEKDRFSYFTNNPSYNGQTANYGFAYQEVRDKNNIKALMVLYVFSSNAKDAGLHRGDLVRLESVNSNIVKLNRLSLKDGGLCENNDYLEFTIEDISGPKNTVLLDTIYTIDNKRIGYLCYLEYGAVDDLFRPLQKFVDNQISEMILDLRYNPGGYVNTCQYLCNCIVPASGYGSVFQQCSYNDILSMEYKKYTGDERTYTYFNFPASSDKETLGVNIIGLQLKKLYVITSSHTASASEATIICLKPYMDVILIGDKTVGKGVGSWNISNPKYQYSIQPITMRYYNANNESTPDEGIVPDYNIQDGFNTNKKEIGNLSETLLNAAILLILNRPLLKPFKTGTPQFDNSLTPIGEPSYVTEFNKKHYNESY